MLFKVTGHTSDLSNEPKKYHTSLFIYDKNLSPAFERLTERLILE